MYTHNRLYIKNRNKLTLTYYISGQNLLNWLYSDYEQLHLNSLSLLNPVLHFLEFVSVMTRGQIMVTGGQKIRSDMNSYVKVYFGK